MSWSVSAVGKPAAMAVNIESQFAAMTYPCPEPEETAKQLVRKAIGALLAGHTKAENIVKVSASGSQAYRTVREATGDVAKDVYNSLSVSVETISGFLE